APPSEPPRPCILPPHAPLREDLPGRQPAAPPREPQPSVPRKSERLADLPVPEKTQLLAGAGDLGVVSGRFQLRPGGTGRLRGTPAQLDFPLEDRQGEAFRIAVAGIEDERAPRHNPPPREPRKRVDPSGS